MSVNKDHAYIEELERKYELLTSIVNAIPEPIIAKDYAGNFVFANKALADLYGTEPDKMVGYDDAHFTGNQEQADFFRENVQAVMQKMQTEVVQEDSFDVESGEVRHFQSIKVPFLSRDNERFITVYAKDITQVTRLKQAAEENEKRLAYALEISGEGLWDWSVQTGEVLHNSTWQELTGIELSEQSFAEFTSLIHAEDRDHVIQSLEKMLHEGGAYDVAFRMRRGEGDYFWAWDRGRVVELDQEGQALRVVGAMRDIDEIVNYQSQVQSLAHMDYLTGLPNRSRLEYLLNEAVQEADKCSGCLEVFFIDLDNFKYINDQHGHQVGDDFLKIAAQRIQQALGEEAVLTRFGGDEFVAFRLSGLVDITAAIYESQQWAEHIHSALSGEVICMHPATGAELCFQLRASIGIAVRESSEQSAEELLRCADLALYRAKNQGRNTSVVFDPAMQQELDCFVSLEADLRQAIRDNEFAVYVQPKVNQNQDWIGGELLLRWRRKDGTIEHPSAFLKIAEESHHIFAIGNWMLEQACTYLQAWQSKPCMQDLSLSVNFSAQQVQQENYAQNVISMVKQAGIDPQKLIIEITETVVMVNLTQAIKQLELLRDFGIRISIDDFGTGYSSLSYLKRLPVDELKIDRAFIRDLFTDESDAMLVKTIVNLSENFKLSVVAEGVETREQEQMLQDFGCRCFQGYLYAKPMSIEKFEQHMSLKATFLRIAHG